MDFQWIINNEDVKLLKDFVSKHKGNNFVKGRIKRNLSDSSLKFSRDEFWKRMIACLLTTQQRSGPNSNISRFLKSSSLILDYNYCKISNNLEKEVYEVLTKFGGIRRTNSISEEVQFNFNWLEDTGWEKITEISKKLIELREQKPNLDNIQIERVACLLVQNLKGIGPKQSRNLWQSLGLTRYEIPIDSRVIKWLNNNKFPFVLSASGLSDENYYQLLMDGIQKWCLKSEIFPCVLDAVIFSSYDPEWPENYDLW